MSKNPTIDSEVEEILHRFALTLLKNKQEIDPVGSITFSEANAAITNLIAQEANKANEQGFYAAMGMCGVKESLVHGYYVMYQDALKNPELSKKAAQLTAENKE